MEKWRAVVDGDVDISQAVAALAPFGKKYVDELARACLVHHPIIPGRLRRNPQ
jgi:hypothetical protein